VSSDNKKYLAYAKECLDLAEKMKDEASKAALLDMSAAWLQVAEDALRRRDAILSQPQ
jgi:hypothetical protein